MDTRGKDDYRVSSVTPCHPDRATIGKIDGLIAALAEIDVVAGWFELHAPLRADLVIALLQAGECGECKFDRRWCDATS